MRMAAAWQNASRLNRCWRTRTYHCDTGGSGRGRVVGRDVPGGSGGCGGKREADGQEIQGHVRKSRKVSKSVGAGVGKGGVARVGGKRMQREDGDQEGSGCVGGLDGRNVQAKRRDTRAQRARILRGAAGPS